MSAAQATSWHPIERAAALQREQPLLAVDTALRAFGDTRGHRSGPETDHYLDILGSAILRASGVTRERGERPFDRVFADSRTDGLATAVLLRLLVLDDDVFTDQQLRGRAFAMLDRRVGPRLYGRLGLSQNAQTFEKRDALRAATEQQESTLLSHVDSLRSLAALAAFRQHLFQLFKDQITQLAISPFLPPGFTQQALSELLSATEACSQADDEHLLQEVERAIQLFDSVDAEVGALPTSYSQSFVGALQARLRTLVTEHVRERGLADPAAIVLRARPKYYPLRTQGAPVTLRLDVINEGSGQAADVELSVQDAQLIDFESSVVNLGRVQPGVARVELRGHVREVGTGDMLIVTVAWRNSDGSEESAEEIIELSAQIREVPWDQLEYEQAYSLEPVTDGTQFAGRQSVLRELTKLLLGAGPGNFTIDGQKRVGKTSLAYALRDRVESIRPRVFAFLFLECGDFNLNTPEDTLARLGTRICELARGAEPATRDVPIPDLSKGLAPLTDFFEECARRAPQRIFVVILDEFDAMPHSEIYDLGAIGTAFFKTLRSLGGKQNLAFGLIGSERMVSVLTAQDQQLNKFRRVQLDYFDDSQLDDYAELIRDPVREWLDLDDEAIGRLFADSAGNPYITKAVGITVFERAVAARDSDVRLEDIEEAISEAMPKLGARSFAHFWDDGISGDPGQQRLVSLARRRVLLGLAALLRRSAETTEAAAITAAAENRVLAADAAEVLRSFRERKVLIQATDGALRCRVPLFARWLADEGIHDIVGTIGDDDAIINRIRAEEEARVKLEDVVPLVERWGLYRGRPVHPEQIRDWLRQFGTPSAQRLMLALLNGVRFFGGESLRLQLRELHRYMERDLAETHGYQYTFKGRERVRNDVVLTALDDGGSGATHLLKPYRDENRLAAPLVVSASRAAQTAASARTPIRALVVLEDFIGTGKTAERRLRRLHDDLYVTGSLSPDVLVYVLVVAGFDEGAARIRRGLETIGWSAHVHVADPLDDADRCFSDLSRIFPDESERHAARAMAIEQGSRLAPGHPLGHEGTEALVVFESRCPNNTLPILWADSETWTPLFPRH